MLALDKLSDMLQVDGGRAIYADGPITLCDRADRTPGRGFDGRLAQLAVYDAALTESNVRTETHISCPQSMMIVLVFASSWSSDLIIPLCP